MIRYKPDRIASAADASRQVGAVEVTPRPIVTANVSNTEDSAVAAKAPSMIGDHCRKRGAASLRATGVTFSIDISMALAKAEEGQNRQNHDNQADEIDKTVHGFLLMSRPFSQSTIGRNRQSSSRQQEKAATDGARRPSRAPCCRLIWSLRSPYSGYALFRLEDA